MNTATISGSEALHELPENADLDAWLARREARVPGLRGEALRKRVVWAGAPGAVTDWSVVYVHGFSASPGEVSPLCEELAARLNANLHFARLTGHGRDGPAMAEASVDAWLADGAEALQIGQRIGRRQLLIATSQGGALATHLLCTGARPEGVVLISPNYGPRHWAAYLLRWPLARYWLPPLVGRTRRLTADNALQEKFWTNEYPVDALFPMMALATAAWQLPVEKLAVPLLMIYAADDQVVSPRRIAKVFSRWGSPKKTAVVVPDSQAPAQHVIAGDACSPETTETVRVLIEQFITRLGP